MKQVIHKVFTKHHIWITFCLVCFVALMAAIVLFGEYRLANLGTKVFVQTEKLASTTDMLNTQIENLQADIASIVEQNNLLSSTVQDQISQSSALADQVEQVADTAVALDKLSKVDPQLLQKYSKVYFLNENYKPSELETIPSSYTFNKKIEYEIHSGIYPHLKKMLDDAADDNIDLLVISAYRSFDTQASLKYNYKIIYGSGTANQFSADQGYSEHQLGTTVDFTTPVLKDNFDTFGVTEAYTWLTKNAYKYGFILSYPQNNSYYVFEPWHWRFVGDDLANKLHRQNKNFYDMDQRTINNYLGLFFD